MASMRQSRKTLPIITAIVAILWMAFAGYFGAYYAMLRERVYDVSPFWMKARFQIRSTSPAYHLESPAIDLSFSPAHELDRKIRPDFWGQ